MVSPRLIAKRIIHDFPFDMGIDKLMRCLRKVKKRFTEQGWSNLRLEEHTAPFSNELSVDLYGDRPETDEEATIREHKEKEAR